MSIYSRLARITKYRNLSQAEIGRWFKLSPAAWGKRERGETKGFPLDELELFLKNTEIDSRWLLGQIDCPIEEADIRLRGPEKTLTQQLLQEIQELRKRTRPLKELDPLAERVINDNVLRRLLEKLIQKRSYVPQIEGYIDGIEASQGESTGRGQAETA